MIVVSDDPNLFDTVRAILRPDSRFIDTEDEVHCDGSVVPFMNIFPVEMTPAEWAGWKSENGQVPDPRSMSTLIFECQSPVWVAEVGTLLGQGMETPVLFVDAVSTLWPADQVDPERIALS